MTRVGSFEQQFPRERDAIQAWQPPGKLKNQYFKNLYIYIYIYIYIYTYIYKCKCILYYHYIINCLCVTLKRYVSSLIREKVSVREREREREKIEKIAKMRVEKNRRDDCGRRWKDCNVLLVAVLSFLFLFV